MSTVVQSVALRTRTAIFGIDCDASTLEGATRLTLDRAASAKGGYVCLGNVHVLVTARHDQELREALERAWLVLADGAPIAWLQRAKGVAPAARTAGADLMRLVCQRGVGVGLRHFLLGSTPHVLACLQRNLRVEFPDVSIVGAYSPSRDEVENDAPEIVQRIRLAAPDIVWCGLGAPRQELWMSRNTATINQSVLLGVGAAFDFLARTKPRAPVWMQHAGLEWAHRLRHEPTRLAGRYVRTNGEFVVQAGVELLRGRRR